MQQLQLAPAIAVAALFFYTKVVRYPYTTPKLWLLIGGALLLLPTIAFRWRENARRDLFTPAVAVLAIWSLSAMLSINPSLCLLGRVNSHSMGVLGVGLALVYFLASRGDVSGWVGLGGAVLGLHALGQQAWADNLPLGRSYGTVGNPVSLGQVLAMSLPFALSQSVVYALAVCLGIWASGSRGAVLAAIVGVAVWRLRK